jgi:hypothetical protein
MLQHLSRTQRFPTGSERVLKACYQALDVAAAEKRYRFSTESGQRVFIGFVIRDLHCTPNVCAQARASLHVACSALLGDSRSS